MFVELIVTDTLLPCRRSTNTAISHCLAPCKATAPHLALLAPAVGQLLVGQHPPGTTVQPSTGSQGPETARHLTWWLYEQSSLQAAGGIVVGELWAGAAGGAAVE